MNRRSFIVQMSVLLASMAVHPALPIKASKKTRKRQITVKLHNELYGGHKDGKMVMEFREETHCNIKYDNYQVFEDGFYLGDMRIHYAHARGSCATMRDHTYSVDFSSVFGHTVTYDEELIYFKYKTKQRYWYSGEPQPNDQIVLLAKKMLNLTIKKTEEIVKNYKAYCERIAQ